MPLAEVHVEQLLGRRVRDADGHVLGRLEEFRVEIDDDGEHAVTEFHVGPAALAERVAGFVGRLPFFGWLPAATWQYRVPWNLMDLSDPRHPKVTVRREELERWNGDAGGR